MSSVFWLTCLLFFIGLTACEEAREDSLDSTTLNATQINGTSPEVPLPRNETDLSGNNTNEGPRPEAPGLTNATDLGTNMSTIGEPDSAGEETTSPGIPTEETAGSSSDVTVTTNSSAPAANESTNAVPSSESPSTAATVTTSSSTSVTSESTKAVPASESTVRTRSTQPSRRTKRPKRPHRKQDHYGTLIDKYGCKHKTLETKGQLFTATCNGKCGRRTIPILNGTPCLYSLPKRGNHNKRENRKCLIGVCYLGKCIPSHHKQLKCKAPRGTVHYYDDGSNYYYNDGGIYDYSYGNYNGDHFHYANSNGGQNIHAE
uniref:Evasin n=1 Tax=Amblyomma triste TaxID=251400 RepID=A0A023G3J1_AMBTT